MVLCLPASPARTLNPPAPCPGCATAAYPALQRNVDTIERSVAKLEERLAHEKEKFGKYDQELQEHEAR